VLNAGAAAPPYLLGLRPRVCEKNCGICTRVRTPTTVPFGSGIFVNRTSINWQFCIVHAREKERKKERKKERESSCRCNGRGVLGFLSV